MHVPLLRAALVSLVLLAGTASAAELEQRWLYLQHNFQVKENVPKAEALLRRAAKAGYNGIVLADYKLNILGRVPEHYFSNMAQFKALADELKIELIPCVAPFGYSEGLLSHDPNLAEGLPVRNMRLKVQGDTALPHPRLSAEAIPGGFERRKEHQFTGWGFQDEPGTGTFADTVIKHGGESSLRIENPKGVRGNRRVSKRLKVQPWTAYHASVWIRTANFESARDVRLFALGAKGRTLSHSNLGVKRDQDWTQHHIMFNSLEADEVGFYLGVWDAGAGQLWMDDAQIEEAPFVNLVRRPGCPLVIADAEGKPLVEGKDFAELHDPVLTNRGSVGHFDVYHEPPVLKLLPGTRVKEGAELNASFYHAVTIYDEQVPASLTDPRVFELVRDQLQRVDKLLKPQRYFLSHDEIRVANWSADETRAKETAGAVLANNVRRCLELVHELNPQAKTAIWSDMFDPHHNAQKGPFYLVNGDLTGSWEGLTKDTLIINWNSGKPAESTKFFGDRGHSQVLAGYYDSDPAAIKAWLKASHGNRVTGVMYTTWQSNFDDLEAFAKAAWGE